LINKVNHTDNKRFKEGCCFLKYDWIMNATGATKDQVKHCIAYLKATSMLATRKATRGFNVEVLKYKGYQNLNNYKSHTESHIKATQKPHKSHTINKNVKNIKEIKHIVDFFNLTLNKSYWSTAKNTQFLITKRLKEGRTIKDFELVIKNRKDRWENDKNMNEYLTPDTLFAEKNFEKYLQDARTEEKQSKEQIA